MRLSEIRALRGYTNVTMLSSAVVPMIEYTFQGPCLTPEYHKVCPAFFARQYVFALAYETLRTAGYTYEEISFNVEYFSKLYYSKKIFYTKTYDRLRIPHFITASSITHNRSDSISDIKQLMTLSLDFFHELALPIAPVRIKLSSGASNLNPYQTEAFMYICDYGEYTIYYNSEFSIGFDKYNFSMQEIITQYNLPDNIIFNEKRAIILACIDMFHIAPSIDNKDHQYLNILSINLDKTFDTIRYQNQRDNKTIWPIKMSPFAAVVVCDEKNLENANRLHDLLVEEKLSLFFDDYPHSSYGYRLYMSEELGVPYIIEAPLEFNDCIQKTECILHDRKNGIVHKLTLATIITMLRYS